jgi:glycosyltransferase involved in cell wall biosynthesis
VTDLAVIMSVYKNDKLEFVDQAVKSMLNQTFRQFDYYIVFDGPVAPDVDHFITTLDDKRIRLYRLEENMGLAIALNYLLFIVLAIPDYKLIARMDADDISMPERLEKQYNFLSLNNDIACIGCWYEEIDESGNHLSYRTLPVDHESLRRRYYTRTPFAHPSVMYRRDLIEKAGFYPVNTHLMEDNALWGKALQNKLKFANMPDVLIKFRIDKGFYRRRSGISYGLNFMKERLRINRTLKFPLYTYAIIVSEGIIKMMPPFFLRIIYLINRK